MKKRLVSLLLASLMAISFASCGGGGGGGSSSPNISVSQASLDFSGVNLENSFDQTIVITNTGNANLNIGQISSSNAAFSIVAPDGASNTTLAPSGSCSLYLRFTPQAQGAATATLSIPSNDPDTSTVTVSLAGEGYGLNVWINQVSGDCSSVDVDVTVTDLMTPGNNPLNALVKADFTLYVNDQPISPDDFAITPIEDPSLVSLVLAMDYSTSLEAIIDELETAANGFISRLNDADVAAICKFNDDIVFLPGAGFTTANGAGKTTLQGYINQAFSIEAQTYLYDAVYDSIDRAATGVNTKRAVLVFSDGSDSDGYGDPVSGNSLDEVIAYANSQNVAVFTILYVDTAYLGGSRGKPEIMQELASETGGLFYNGNPDNIDDILTQITNVLSNKYTLSFTPSSGCPGTVSVDVRVELDGGLYGQHSKSATLPTDG